LVERGKPTVNVGPVIQDETRQFHPRVSLEQTGLFADSNTHIRFNPPAAQQPPERERLRQAGVVKWIASRHNSEQSGDGRGLPAEQLRRLS
jgi:hypothetical protein